MHRVGLNLSTPTQTLPTALLGELQRIAELGNALHDSLKCHILRAFKSPQGMGTPLPWAAVPAFNNLSGKEIFILPTLNLLFFSRGLKTTWYPGVVCLLADNSKQPFNFEFLLYLRLQANKKKRKIFQ